MRAFWRLRSRGAAGHGGDGAASTHRGTHRSCYTAAVIYFKHLYGRRADEWGVVAFPNVNRACRDYRHDQLVLLAITQNPLPIYGEEVPAELRGCVFAYCTMLRLIAATHEIASPVMVEQYPQVVEQWDRAMPIHRMWRLVTPWPYSQLPVLSANARDRHQRGQLIRIPDVELALANQVLGTEAVESENVYHSPRVRDFLQRLHGAADA